MTILGSAGSGAIRLRIDLSLTQVFLSKVLCPLPIGSVSVKFEGLSVIGVDTGQGCTKDTVLHQVMKTTLLHQVINS